jgi:hypothetical protein
MNKKFFMVFVEGEELPKYQHDTEAAAEKEAQRLADKLGKNAFVLEANKTVTPSNVVDSFSNACKYLGRDVAGCGSENPHHKAITAIFKLVTIAEAWNIADEFVPDFSNDNQWKYIPWFKYKKATGSVVDQFGRTVSYGTSAGFVCVNSACVVTAASVDFGSRMCFKTSERAIKFGEQFIDLWNDFLL